MLFTREMGISPRLQRFALIAGEAGIAALARAKALVFGLGGVGSWCAEALVRSGVGSVALIDSDVVCVTNLNRQAQATGATIGRLKAEALRERLAAIAPDASLTAFPSAFSRENAGSFGIESADYVIDAIDSLTCKLDLIEYAHEAGAHLVSSMGMAQKLDPTRIKTADIWETEGCALARLVRAGLRKRGFTGHFTAVYSAEHLPLHEEIPTPCGTGDCFCPSRAESGAHEWCAAKKVINGSAVPVTAAAGMVLASLVLRDVLSRAGSAGSKGGSENEEEQGGSRDG